MFYRKIIVDIKLEYTANSLSFETRIHILSTTYPQFVNKCVLFILFDTLIIANHIFYYKFIDKSYPQIFVFFVFELKKHQHFYFQMLVLVIYLFPMNIVS